jgi:hypothetical protein
MARVGIVVSGSLMIVRTPISDVLSVASAKT